MGLGEFALQEFRGVAHTQKRFIADFRLGQHLVVRVLFFNHFNDLVIHVDFKKSMPFF